MAKQNDKLNNFLKLCFVIAASPTDGFFSQVSMFRISLNSLGGIYRHADIMLSLGYNNTESIPDRWSKYLTERTIVAWANPSDFQRIGNRAQGDNKWKYDYSAYDLVIFCDADTILVKPIDELLVLTRKKNAIAGVIAHYPFPYNDDENLNELWQYYSKIFTGKAIQQNYLHTFLINNEQNKNMKSPFYLNFGFVIMTQQAYTNIRESYLDIRSKITPLLKDPIFSGQIALTLAIHKHNVPTHSIKMKYNFPNDPIAESLYPDQVRDIHVIHYLRTNKFDRQKIFTTEETFNEFLSLELDGSNKIFQEHIRAITDGIYPFSSPKAFLPRPNIFKKALIKLLKIIKDINIKKLLKKNYLVLLKGISNAIIYLRGFGITRQNIELIKTSGLFDTDWYLDNNPDVAQRKIDPLVHYLKYGGREGRDPSRRFSSHFYLETNKDVRKANINPLLHYIKYGKKEGHHTQNTEQIQK